jgi:hypothetical protein
MSKKTTTEKAVKQLIQVINSYDFTISEIVYVFSQLGYAIGASIAGLTEETVDLPTLERQYYSNPTIDIALMLQSTLISTWIEDFKKHPVLFSKYIEPSTTSKTKEKEKNE